MTTFTIGCDPELFLTRGGKAISGHDIIPGTKEKPFAVDKGALQADGTAAEFNTDPVDLEDFAAFEHNVTSVMKTLEETVKKVDPSLSLNISPVQHYDEEYFKSLPKSAVELGCNPDWNAYTGEPNPTPDHNRLFRTGSGHIHYGWGQDIPATHPDHIKICCDFVKVLDAFVGGYMTMIDDDNLRRELYGKAGAFRPKSYGVEYRTPSNVWLKSAESRKAIHCMSQAAVYAARGMDFFHRTIKKFNVQEIINTGNKVEAAKLHLRLRDDFYMYGDATAHVLADRIISLDKKAKSEKGYQEMNQAPTSVRKTRVA